MACANLEHINITVSNPKETAARLCALFDWHIRWEGPAMDKGYPCHIGTDTHYIAVYAPSKPTANIHNDVKTIGQLNHIAIAVDDLTAMERKIKAAGYRPFNHRHYLETQNCFYFRDEDGIEFEILHNHGGSD